MNKLNPDITKLDVPMSSKSSPQYRDIAVDKEGNIYVGDIIGNKLLKYRIRDFANNNLRIFYGFIDGRHFKNAFHLT